MLGALVVLLTGHGICLDTNVTYKTPLYIGGLVPMGARWRTFHGVQVGAQLAVEDINSRDDVLPDYELIVEWRDSRVRVLSSCFKCRLMFLAFRCEIASQLHHHLS